MKEEYHVNSPAHELVQWTGQPGDFPLEEIALRLRKDIINMVWAGKSGHPGGSLSATELLTYLFFKEMG